MFRVIIASFGLYIILTAIVNFSCAHFTTNSKDLQNLLEDTKNNEILTDLASFIQTEEETIAGQKYLVKLLDEEEVILPSYHPGRALRLFRVRAIEIPMSVEEIQDRAESNCFNGTRWNSFISMLPKPDDLRFIIKGLIRLMDVYKLTPLAVANGRILRHKSRGLNLAEIADIGLIAHTFLLEDSIDGDMSSVIMQWLYLGSSEAMATGEHELCYQIEVALIQCVRHIFKQNDCQCTTDMTNAHKMWMRANPDRSLPPVSWTCDVQKKPARCMQNLNKNTKEHDNFFSLCQNKQPVYFAEKHVRLAVKDQYCKLDHNNNPWLILQPTKVEIRSPEYPYKMVELHDILSENEIDYLMKHPENMTRGTINVENKQGLVSDRRIGENAHLPYEKHSSPVVKRIWARLSAISNLTMNWNTTESLRLANYATTGYFSSHTDFLMNRTLDKNNRFVTFLLYLNDVDGGETVFPFLNVRVEARRGKGFMFNNLFRNTTGMMDTRHGSCPVITGDKWIVTHWVYRFGQEFSHKCSLNQFE